MPYDKQIVDHLLQSADIHKRMPNADYVAALVEQLKGVEPVISQLSGESRDLRTDATVAKRSLAQEEDLHRQTRDELRKAKEEIARLEGLAAMPNPPEKKTRAKKTQATTAE